MPCHACNNARRGHDLCKRQPRQHKMVLSGCLPPAQTGLAPLTTHMRTGASRDTRRATRPWQSRVLSKLSPSTPTSPAVCIRNSTYQALGNSHSSVVVVVVVHFVIPTTSKTTHWLYTLIVRFADTGFCNPLRGQARLPEHSPPTATPH